MLRRRQLKVLLAELAAIDDASSSRQNMNGSFGRERVILKPLVEKVPVLFETDSKVFKEFERESMHLVVLLLEKGLYPLVLFLGREWSVFVKR